MKKYYVIRRGWNGANQSSMGTTAKPRNCFESRAYMLVHITEAQTEREACTLALEAGVSVYNGQILFATANPRGFRGLTNAILSYKEEVAQ